MSNLFIINVYITSLFATFQFFTLNDFLRVFIRSCYYLKKYLNTTLLEMYVNLQKFFMNYLIFGVELDVKNWFLGPE